MRVRQIVGFSGTRHGMTYKQWNAFCILAQNLDMKQFHHGDCLGADAQAHRAVDHNIWPMPDKIVIHPGDNPQWRAYCADQKDNTIPILVWAEKPNIERNHDIVDCSKVMIIAAGTMQEQQRSGTWATYRYAVKQQKVRDDLEIHLILPDGTTTKV